MLVVLGLTLDIHHHHLVTSECLVHDLFHALHQEVNNTHGWGHSQNVGLGWAGLGFSLPRPLISGMLTHWGITRQFWLVHSLGCSPWKKWFSQASKFTHGPQEQRPWSSHANKMHAWSKPSEKEFQWQKVWKVLNLHEFISAKFHYVMKCYWKNSWKPPWVSSFKGEFKTLNQWIHGFGEINKLA
jgi:hypothetical protein